MSGRGRKKPQRGASVHRSQPASRKGGGPTRARSTDGSTTDGASRPDAAGSAEPQRAARSAPRSGVRGGQPVSAGTRRPSGPAARRGPARPPRDVRRKRNQRIGVIIGALALAGVLVGSVLLGQQNGSTAQAQDPGATNSVAPSATAAAATTAPTATAPASPVTPMVITCPTGGGASVVFGHEIVVPAPYKVTITYGDGDQYSNDSAHLGAIFSHTYKKAGTYAVTAVLTAPSGGTATANCSYTWGP